MLNTQEYESFEPEVEIEWMKSKPWWKFEHFQTESVMSNLLSGKYASSRKTVIAAQIGIGLTV